MTFLKSPPPSSLDPTAAVPTSFRPTEARLSPSRFAAAVLPCALLFVLVAALAPWIGSSTISLNGVISGTFPDREIFVIARLPRILFAGLAGGALAVSGVLFQA